MKEDKAVGGGAEPSEDEAHQERVKVLSESGFGKQRQLYFFQNNLLSLVLAARGLHGCTAFSPAAARRALSLAAAGGLLSDRGASGLLTAAASVAEHGLQGAWASAAAAPGP